MYRLRKATQGCGFSFSNVICTFFLYLINIIKLLTLFFGMRGTLEMSRLLPVFTKYCLYEFQVIEINYFLKITINMQNVITDLYFCN